MVEMIDTAAELQADNPQHRAIDVGVFADALEIYREASANIRANGAIVSHPRTGAPIENPYLRVQTAKGAVLAKMRGIKCDRVIELLDAQVAI